MHATFRRRVDTSVATIQCIYRLQRSLFISIVALAMSAQIQRCVTGGGDACYGGSPAQAAMEACGCARPSWRGTGRGRPVRTGFRRCRGRAVRRPRSCPSGNFRIGIVGVAPSGRHHCPSCIRSAVFSCAPASEMRSASSSSSFPSPCRFGRQAPPCCSCP